MVSLCQVTLHRLYHATDLTGEVYWGRGKWKLEWGHKREVNTGKQRNRETEKMRGMTSRGTL